MPIKYLPSIYSKSLLFNQSSIYGAFESGISDSNENQRVRIYKNINQL